MHLANFAMHARSAKMQKTHVLAEIVCANAASCICNALMQICKFAAALEPYFCVRASAHKCAHTMHGLAQTSAVRHALRLGTSAQRLHRQVHAAPGVRNPPMLVECKMRKI